MRINQVRIENFRALSAVEFGFDDVTTLIGPNGVGKSTVLRALDWFFNDSVTLDAEDIHSGAGQDAEVSVAVTFTDLTNRDREIFTDLGVPAPQDEVVVERRWAPGVDRYLTPSQTFEPFTAIRAIGGAVDRRKAYVALREDHRELPELAAQNLAAVQAAMTAYEAGHPELCTPGEKEIEAPFRFGSTATAPFTGVFDFVFVDADLRAADESDTGRSTIISRILSRHLDDAAAREKFARIAETANHEQTKIVRTEITPHLDRVSGALTDELGTLTKGRSIRLIARPVSPRPPATAYDLVIDDAGTSTSVDHQGHGFQRALLITSLKFLATAGQALTGTVVLAIEEPELFQHPSQARVFARVLRELGEDPVRGFQIAYATHSPYFIDAARFEQVRRLTSSTNEDGRREATVHQASRDEVIARLEPLIKVDGIRSRWEQVCTDNLAEAFFAAATILVEGTGDVGVLDGLAHRDDLPWEDLDVVVADAHGKSGLLTLAAVLESLAIPTVVVFDNDRDLATRIIHRAESKDDPPAYIAASVAAEEKSNRAILAFHGQDATDAYPVGKVTPNVFALDDELETVLQQWPEWDSKRKELIKDERGSAKKNAATYSLATREADGTPPQVLLDIVTAARALVGHVQSNTEESA